MTLATGARSLRRDRGAVVGIAGPGESLASDDAIESFARIHARWPELTLLSPWAATLRVTVNSVSPEIRR